MAINFKVGVELDDKQLQSRLGTIRQEIERAFQPRGQNSLYLTKDLAAATQQAMVLEKTLSKAILNNGSVSKFNLDRELAKAGTTANQLTTTLAKGGSLFAQSLAQANTALATASSHAIKINGALVETARVFAQSFKFSLAQRTLQAITSAAQEAVYWVKDLNRTINDIAVVSNKSAPQIDAMTASVIKASQELRVAAKDYAQSALIFYQQGLNDEQVAQRTEITVKAAKAAGQDIATMSQQLTAVWNTYGMIGDEQARAASVGALMAAKSASNFQDTAEAMQIAASAASQMGVSYDSLAAQIATIRDTTQQSASVIGNALKTIFSRFEQLKAEGSDGEVTLGQVSNNLKKLGVDILDEAGNLRDLQEVIEETGNNWDKYNKKQQLAIAEQVGGTRQFGQFLALMQNFSKYQNLMTAAAGETGTETLEQQYTQALESITEKASMAKEAWNRAFDGIIQEGALKTLYEALEALGHGFEGMIDTAGGLPGILMAAAAIASKKLVPALMQGGVAMGKSLIGAFNTDYAMKQAQQAASQRVAQAQYATQQAGQGGNTLNQGLVLAQEKQVKTTAALSVELERLRNIEKSVTGDQKVHTQFLIQECEQMIRLAQATQQATIALEELYAAQKQAQSGTAEKAMGSLKGLGNLIDTKSSPKKVTSALGLASKDLDSAIKSGALTRGQVNAAAANAGATNHAKMSLDKLLETLSKTPGAMNAFTQSLTRMVGNAEGATQAMQNLARAEADLANAQGNQRATEEDYKQQTGKNLPKVSGGGKIEPEKMTFDQKAEIGSNIAGSLMSVAMSAQMVTSVFQTFADETSTTGEKMGSLLMALGFLVPTALSFLGTVKLLRNTMVTTISVQNAAKASLTAHNMAINENTLAQKANAIATRRAAIALGIFGIALAALTFIIPKIVSAVKSMTAEGQLEQAQKSASLLSDSLRDANESFSTLSEGISTYDEAVKAINSCKKGTQEWTESLNKANDEARKLLDAYPELAIMGDAVKVNSDGLIEISNEGIEQATEKLTQQISTLQESERIASQIVSEKKIAVDKKDLMKSSPIAAGIVSGGSNSTAGEIRDNMGILNSLSGDELRDKIQEVTSAELTDKQVERYAAAIEGYGDAIVSLLAEIAANTAKEEAYDEASAMDAASDAGITDTKGGELYMEGRGLKKFEELEKAKAEEYSEDFGDFAKIKNAIETLGIFGDNVELQDKGNNNIGVKKEGEETFTTVGKDEVVQMLANAAAKEEFGDYVKDEVKNLDILANSTDPLDNLIAKVIALGDVSSLTGEELETLASAENDQLESYRPFLQDFDGIGVNKLKSLRVDAKNAVASTNGGRNLDFSKLMLQSFDESAGERPDIDPRVTGAFAKKIYSNLTQATSDAFMEQAEKLSSGAEPEEQARIQQDYAKTIGAIVDASEGAFTGDKENFPMAELLEGLSEIDPESASSLSEISSLLSDLGIDIDVTSEKWQELAGIISRGFGQGTAGIEDFIGKLQNLQNAFENVNVGDTISGDQLKAAMEVPEIANKYMTFNSDQTSAFMTNSALGMSMEAEAAKVNNQAALLNEANAAYANASTEYQRLQEQMAKAQSLLNTGQASGVSDWIKQGTEEINQLTPQLAAAEATLQQTQAAAQDTQLQILSTIGSFDELERYRGQLSENMYLMGAQALENQQKWDGIAEEDLRNTMDYLNYLRETSDELQGQTEISEALAIDQARSYLRVSQALEDVEKNGATYLKNLKEINKAEKSGATLTRQQYDAKKKNIEVLADLLDTTDEMIEKSDVMAKHEDLVADVLSGAAKDTTKLSRAMSKDLFSAVESAEGFSEAFKRMQQEDSGSFEGGNIKIGVDDSELVNFQNVTAQNLFDTLAGIQSEADLELLLDDGSFLTSLNNARHAAYAAGADIGRQFDAAVRALGFDMEVNTEQVESEGATMSAPYERTVMSMASKTGHIDAVSVAEDGSTIIESVPVTYSVPFYTKTIGFNEVDLPANAVGMAGEVIPGGEGEITSLHKSAGGGSTAPSRSGGGGSGSGGGGKGGGGGSGSGKPATSETHKRYTNKTKKTNLASRKKEKAKKAVDNTFGQEQRKRVKDYQNSLIGLAKAYADLAKEAKDYIATDASELDTELANTKLGIKAEIDPESLELLNEEEIQKALDDWVNNSGSEANKEQTDKIMEIIEKRNEALEKFNESLDTQTDLLDEILENKLEEVNRVKDTVINFADLNIEDLKDLIEVLGDLGKFTGQSLRLQGDVLGQDYDKVYALLQANERLNQISNNYQDPTQKNWFIKNFAGGNKELWEEWNDTGVLSAKIQEALADNISELQSAKKDLIDQLNTIWEAIIERLEYFSEQWEDIISDIETSSSRADSLLDILDSIGQTDYYQKSPYELLNMNQDVDARILQQEKERALAPILSEKETLMKQIDNLTGLRDKSLDDWKDAQKRYVNVTFDSLYEEYKKGRKEFEVLDDLSSKLDKLDSSNAIQKLVQNAGKTAIQVGENVLDDVEKIKFYNDLQAAIENKQPINKLYGKALFDEYTQLDGSVNQLQQKMDDLEKQEKDINSKYNKIQPQSTKSDAKYGDNYLAARGLIYEQEAKNKELQLQAYKEEYDLNIEKAKQIKAELDVLQDEVDTKMATGIDIDPKTAQTLNNLKSDYREVSEAAQDALDGMIKTVQDAIEWGQKAASDLIGQRIDEWNQIVFSFKGEGEIFSPDNMKELYDLQKGIDTFFLDEYDAGYELNKLKNGISQQTLDITDPSRLAKYADLMKQIEDIQKRAEENQEGKVNLSQVELDVLQAQFDVEKARDEYEDSRKQKNTMRLVRDASGNFNYQYSSSGGDDELAKYQAWKDEEANLNKIRREGAEAAEEAWIEYYLKLNELLQLEKEEGMYWTDEQKAMFSAQVKYYEDYLNHYGITYDDLRNQLDKKSNASTLSQIADFKSLSDYTQDTVIPSFHTLVEEVDGDLEYWRNWTNEMTKGVQDDFDSTEDFVSGQLDLMIKKYGDTRDAVKDLREKTKTYLDNSATDINNWVNTVSSYYDNLISKINEAIDAYKELYAAANPSYDTKTDYSGLLIDLAKHEDKTSLSDEELIKWMVEKYPTLLDERMEKSVKLLGEDRKLHMTREQEAGYIVKLLREKYGNSAMLDFGKDSIYYDDFKYLLAETGGTKGTETGTTPPDTKKDGPPDAERVKAIINKIHNGTYGVGWANRKKKALNDKFTEEEFNAAQALVQAYYGKSGYTVDKIVETGIANGTIKKYLTGGLADFTGLAWLDGSPTKPELILNPEDTANIRAAIAMIKTSFDFEQYLNRVGRPGLSSSGVEIQPVQQEVSIAASFPNVSVAREIEEALNNIVNQAVQYVSRRN